MNIFIIDDSPEKGICVSSSAHFRSPKVYIGAAPAVINESCIGCSFRFNIDVSAHL